jgi:hypothetical protein
MSRPWAACRWFRQSFGAPEKSDIRKANHSREWLTRTAVPMDRMGGEVPPHEPVI